jgi:hypothetical protein
MFTLGISGGADQPVWAGLLLLYHHLSAVIRAPGGLTAALHVHESYITPA